MIRKLFFFPLVVGLLMVGSSAEGAKTLTPGFITLEDLDADPEPVTVTSYGVDPFDPDTFRKSATEEVNLEVYELQPGIYYFINDPAGATDLEALNADVGDFALSNAVADTGADGVMFRGLGSYPGAAAISFGLLRDYPELPRLPDGSIDTVKAAATVGYKFYQGRRNFAIDGVVAVFENLAVGDHANNNEGVLHTFGDGRLFCRDVWVYNVYDGVFWDDGGEGYFVNCIFHQTYQPWNFIDDAQAAGYFDDDVWNVEIAPRRNQGIPDFVEHFASVLGIDIDLSAYPEVAGILIGNDTASGYNINLFETEDADPQFVYLKNCTIVRHQIQHSNRLWRHNVGAGLGAYVVIEDCMILSVDLSPSPNIRLDTDDDDFLGYINNTKFWNYAADSATLVGMDLGNWNDGGFYGTDPASHVEFNVDAETPGGLDITDVTNLFRLDARNLTTFKPGAIELTMATDGGQVGYRLPDTAPPGPLPVTSGEVTPIRDWSLY